ncbi:VTT domain-containing protein [Pseudobacteroides cellulosolvens]|uniref:SNARE associated protein n=1 Tax=Pseudobacteroides cellulosolvens ATCC 35603 = DSM 2933 TaxID=398512 RepID=A0A0L6JU65_9FIRM|nr:VTT domain-containing protein [Pseudobacteroides cellulosolvens]KNY29363.1 SNARE associated protein [Pseudobacteroides cellulosolvens ATCC 35603 = DSM 2933]
MGIVLQSINIISNLDTQIIEMIQKFGSFAYMFLFLIVFSQTGLFMAPFLPGETLLFVVGTLSASGTMNIWIATFSLILAAILGDAVNYNFGKYFGPKIFKKQNVWLLNRKHLDQAHAFYEKHGGKTIILAKFLPLVRTVAPFAAGMGKMPNKKFINYNIMGGVAWVSVNVFLGYFFGKIPMVKNNFLLVVIAVVAISIIPGIVTWTIRILKSKRAAASK